MSKKIIGYTDPHWESITWAGIGSFTGRAIWNAYGDTYCNTADGSRSAELNKTTYTWESVSLGANILGEGVWTDGENTYYSSGSTQKVFNNQTKLWENKTWTGMTAFAGTYIWTDGEHIYYSDDTTQKVLDKQTGEWSDKTWTGLASFDGQHIWTDGENIYYSKISTHKVLNKQTGEWEDKTWTGITSFSGNQVYTAYGKVYYNNRKVLNKQTCEWEDKTLEGASSIDGQYVWTDGAYVFYSMVDGNDNIQKALIPGEPIYEEVIKYLDDNGAQKFADKIKEVDAKVNNLPSPITPKGTVAFANLPALSGVSVGWMYNISDDFTTDSNFVTSGIACSAGSNVYCLEVSGTKKWDVFAVADTMLKINPTAAQIANFPAGTMWLEVETV